MSEANIYQFTTPYIDRKVAEGIFRELLQTKEAYRVFNIYGDIGTGKSRFISHIINKYLNNKKSKFLYVKLDFENRVLHSQKSAILAMAKELQNRYNFNFSTLWKAYAILWHKRYQKSPLIYANDLPYIDEIKKLFKIDKKGHPIIEIVKGFFKESIKKELEALKGLDTKEIENRLHKFFINDIKELVKQKGFKDAVIIFENYHLLEEVNASTPCMRDLWVRDMIALANKDVAFVIVTRDKLKWQQCNIVWKSALKSYQMKPFVRREATLFLNSIDNMALKEGIIISSGTLPFWLSIGKYGIKTAKIPTVKKDLIDNFIASQKDEIVKLLHILTHTRFFNLDMLNNIKHKFELNLNSSDINNLLSFDFIKKNGNRYIIDELFREEFFKIQTETQIKEATTFIFSYFENMLHSLDKEIIKATPSIVDEVIEEAWYYLRKINHNIIDHLKWLNYYVDRFFMYAAWEPFIDRYLQIAPEVEKLNDTEHLVTLYNNLAGLYESIGEYELSKEYYKKVVNLNRPKQLIA